ncbi:hypothetical protein RRG08_064748 [Elysia crispata]|uniref:Uncharacterized protein n=1 Tax=Elysia crispata TaxID=231223 RepID=A0AAE1D899_9GAST|nr:hypothetical protein RRG08_064748 [Elysia crispata]
MSDRRLSLGYHSDCAWAAITQSLFLIIRFEECVGQSYGDENDNKIWAYWQGNHNIMCSEDERFRRQHKRSRTNARW